jgi:hypothetical protein
MSSNCVQQLKQTYTTVIAGGGIAGLVTALTLLEGGATDICVIDRDTKTRLGGLARWAFGGMALCETAEQKRMKVPDSPQILLEDWLRFGEILPENNWQNAWAKEYAEKNHQDVYLWLKSLGLRFMPAVNWVERGLNGEGNSMPRYHVLWGTGWQLIETIISKLTPFLEAGKLTIIHQHKVQTPIINEQHQAIEQVLIENEITKQQSIINCTQLVIACGGINGSVHNVIKHWPKQWGDAPSEILNGANPISDGELHHQAKAIGANVTHVENMWNYAAGIDHTKPDFVGHGLSLIPCKSALWLDHQANRIGPLPLVTGFDTNYLCKQVAKLEKPWTWHLLNWRIAIKELAVSGSLHNPSIRDHKLLSFLKEILFGNTRLINQLVEESDDFICADNVAELAKKMNQRTDSAYIDDITLLKTIKTFDKQLEQPITLENDDQLRRIHHARQWRPDKLRTCKPKPILDEKSGPLIAIKVKLISRKSLGGIQTNLQSQVLTEQQQVIKGLYCVGEAAGFGGGGASGKRSLEGTFLSSCIITAKNAARAILAQ